MVVGSLVIGLGSCVTECLECGGSAYFEAHEDEEKLLIFRLLSIHKYV